MTRIATIRAGIATPQAAFGGRSAVSAAIKGSFLTHGFTGKGVVEERRFSAALGQTKLGALAPEVRA
jgi:hypothetical protein